MTVKIQVIIAIIVIIALSIIVNMIRKKRLELRYALAWLIVGVGTLVLDCFPKLIKWISDLVGYCSPCKYVILFWILFFIDHYFCVNGCYFESVYTNETIGTGTCFI